LQYWGIAVPKFNAWNAKCPARAVLAQIADKWTVLVLGVLLEGTTRFNELRRRVQGVSQKMLTQTLRDLERRGMVSREIFAEVPPRVEYSLTPLGRSLVAVLETVTDWAEAHTQQVLDAQKKFDQSKAASASRTLSASARA
jgi:DNA-binding HxlR family transcriptional regulator